MTKPGLLAAIAVVAAYSFLPTQGDTNACDLEDQYLTWDQDSLAGCESLSMSMGSCCGNSIASQVNESAGEAICRTATMATPFCENDAIGCDNFEPNSTFSLNFVIDVTYPDVEETCCQRCKCYGDPLCEAFDGSRAQMIECDARNFSTCELEQDICRLQFDHAGNRCKWLKGNSNFPWWVNNLESGSPCQADYSVSGQLKHVMVSVDGYSVSSLIGERGVQTDILIGMPGIEGTFNLSSDVCYDYDPRDMSESKAAKAWSLPSGVSSIPSYWTVSAPNNVDIVWHVGSEELGMYVDVVCTRAAGATRTRLDIENITDTQGLDGDGYCYTGVFESGKQSGTNVGDTKSHYDCLQRSLPSVVTTCKALTDDSCTAQTVPGWQQYWCETAELEYTQASVGASTYAQMVATCISEITNGTDDQQATTWDTYACQMNSETPYGGSSQNSYVNECLDSLEQEGYYSWSQKYTSIIEHQWTVTETCVTSIENFTNIPDDDTCASGLMVEVYKNDVWTPVLYFPPESPPCDGSTIEATGDKFPDFFKYEIRLRQCGLSAECLAAQAGTDCKPVISVDAELTFSGASCILSGETCETCTRDFTSSIPKVCTSSAQETYNVGYCENCCTTNNYLPGEENQTCRELVVDSAFCDSSDSSVSSYCSDLKKKKNNGLLTINFTSPDGETDSNCCNSCALWGDPFGQAFNGTRQKLIICDSRDDTCFSQEDACENMVDHKGNACLWNQTLADLIGGKKANIGAYGSPCQPDWSTSGEATITLYSTSDPYEISFNTGERSILDKMFLTTPKGKYTLDPEACYDGSEYAGWTTEEGEDISTALNLTFTGASEDGYGNDERVWAVLEPNLGIFFRVTCVNSEAVDANFVGGYRLNIEHLIDTDLSRDASGYCVSADLVAYGGDYTPNQYAVECEDSLSSDLLACKAFWAGSCTPDQIELGVEKWCETANQPNTVAQCVKSIKKSSSSKTATLWTKAVCTALLPLKQSTDTDNDFLRECEDLASTSGYYAIVENYGSAGDFASVQSYCASSADSYGSRSETSACITGISVQYDSGDGWEELFFIPSNYKPCNGVLEIPAYKSKYWPLFAYPIRFEQCDVDSTECSAYSNVEATCMSSSAFDVTLTYSYDDIGCPADQTGSA